MQPLYLCVVAIAVSIGAALAFAWSRGAIAGAPTMVAGPDIRAVVFHAPGPSWSASVPYRQQPGIQAHIEHYRGLLASKTLDLGGPFLDDTGGMMIAQRGITVDALKQIAAEDPAVKSGLLTATVKPWMIGMKAD